MQQEGRNVKEDAKNAHIFTNGSSNQRRNSASTMSSCLLGSIMTSRSSSTSMYVSAPASRARSVSLSSGSFAAVATAGALPRPAAAESISDGSSILTSTQEEDEDDDAAAARVLAANTLANANRNRLMSINGGKKVSVPLIGVGRQIVRRGSTRPIEEDGVGEWTLLLGASEGVDEKRIKRENAVTKMRGSAGAGRMLSVPTVLGKDAAGRGAERMRTKSESALCRSATTANTSSTSIAADEQDWTLLLPGLGNKKSFIRAAATVAPLPSISSTTSPATVSACESEDDDSLCVPRVVSIGSGIDSAVSASLIKGDDNSTSSIAPRESGNLENLQKLEKDLEKFNAMLLRAPSLGLGALKHTKSYGILPVDEPPPKNAVLRSVEVFSDDAATVGAMASTLSVPLPAAKRIKSTATLRIDTFSGSAAVRRVPSTSSTKSSSSSSAELTPTVLSPSSSNVFSMPSQPQPPAQPQPQAEQQSLKSASPPRAEQRDSTLSVGSSNDIYFSDSSFSGEYYSARSSFTSALTPDM